MENEILKLAMSQGIFAALFIWLLFYVLKKQEARDKKTDERESKAADREINYQDIISKLTEKLNVIDDVKSDVEEIKDILRK